MVGVGPYLSDKAGNHERWSHEAVWGGTCKLLRSIMDAIADEQPRTGYQPELSETEGQPSSAREGQRGARTSRNHASDSPEQRQSHNTSS